MCRSGDIRCLPRPAIVILQQISIVSISLMNGLTEVTNITSLVVYLIAFNFCNKGYQNPNITSRAV